MERLFENISQYKEALQSMNAIQLEEMINKSIELNVRSNEEFREYIKQSTKIIFEQNEKIIHSIENAPCKLNDSFLRENGFFNFKEQNGRLYELAKKELGI